MTVLQVSNLYKHYEKFALEDVNFALEEGHIMGFIGRNGAGKTTTLKSLLHFVHPDSGQIHFFGSALAENERRIKQRIGYVAGGVDFYPKKKLSTITRMTKGFYDDWDDAAYARCMERFHLDGDKTPSQLSAGMKVKYALTLALSHHACLLLLDEPTSGLDSVSRDELLELFLTLVREQGVSILFSTHITSDLDKCADDITYIRAGRILASQPIEDFRDAYRAVTFQAEELPEEFRPLLIGIKQGKREYSALVRAQDAVRLPIPAQPADLETIMVHLEKEGDAC